MPLPLVGARIRESLPDQEEKQGCDYEKNDGVARQAISEALPARSLEILLHGQRPDVARAALVEVAGAGVMDRVLPTPMIIGGESKNSSDKAHEVIRASR